MTFNYESWLKQAQDRLEKLYQQRASIDEEIAALQRGIEGFSPLVRKYPPWLGETTSITDAIRQVFKSEPHTLYSPTHLRDELLNRGIKLTQRNPMATIHQILARLLAKNMIKPHVMEGRTLYQWAVEERPSASPRLKIRKSGTPVSEKK